MNLSDNDLDSDNEKLIASCFDFIDSDYNGDSDDDSTEFNQHAQQHHSYQQQQIQPPQHRTIGPFFNINNIEDFHKQPNQQQKIQYPIQQQQQQQQQISKQQPVKTTDAPPQRRREKTNKQQQVATQQPSALPSSTSPIAAVPPTSSKVPARSNKKDQQQQQQQQQRRSIKKQDELSSIKILKRNEDNIDPEQLNKLFNKPVNEEDSSTQIQPSINKSNGKRRNQNNISSNVEKKHLKNNSNLKHSVSRKDFNRKLGESPLHYDLESVLFSPANTFQVKEVVLVPRSRGGFTYGKILSIVNSDTCNHDIQVKHQVLQYRAVYPSGSGVKNDNFYKDLPASYLGKLEALTSITRTKRSTLISRPDLPQVLPDIIGKKPSLRDLNSLVFSPSSKFHSNQIVLVPRSRGGFTYGCIVKECKVSCKVDNIKHEVPGYRVIVERSQQITIIKDVIIGNIGRLFTATENPNPKQIYPIITPLKPQIQQKNGKSNHPSSNTPKSKIDENQEDNDNVDDDDDDDDDEVYDDDDDDYEDEDSEEDEESEDLELKNFSDDENRSIDDEEEEILWTGDTSPTTTTTTTAQTSENLSNSTKLVNDQVVSQPAVPTVVSNPQQTLQNNSPSAPRGVLEMPYDSIFYTQTSRQKKTHAKSVIVIDGPNVAKCNPSKKFTVSLLKKALEYYNVRGYDVIAFVPQSYVSTKTSHEPGKNFTLFEYRDIADDITSLMKLVEENLVSLTPAQDYDDSYTIQYAKKHNACIVTNDRYNDHIESQESHDISKVKRFIREHCISFTFAKGEFLPNPDFKFPV